MKNQINRKIVISAVMILAAVLLISCSKKDPLLGTWLEPISGISLKFNNDNTLVIGRSGTSITVDYEERNPNIIAITGATNGTIPVQSMTYQITGDKLIITVDKVDTIFTRVK